MANWTNKEITGEAQGHTLRVTESRAQLMIDSAYEMHDDAAWTNNYTLDQLEELADLYAEAVAHMRGEAPAASGLKIGDVLTTDSPEPPVGTVLMDKTGDFWKRFAENDWACTYRLEEFSTYAHGDGEGWDALVTEWAPMIVFRLP